VDSGPSGLLGAIAFAVATVAEDVGLFSVVTVDDELAGEALLWGIDTHNRSGQVGLALLPSFRGHGLSHEVLELLSRYGFTVRGLNRLQLDTTVGNEPMIRSAKRAGFAEEGVLRQARWCLGSFQDALIMGLLAEEWARKVEPFQKAFSCGFAGHY
jgi:RimJ/RimL family protein N-acetyltransferase